MLYLIVNTFYNKFTLYWQKYQELNPDFRGWKPTCYRYTTLLYSYIFRKSLSILLSQGTTCRAFIPNLLANLGFHPQVPYPIVLSLLSLFQIFISESNFISLKFFVDAGPLKIFLFPLEPFQHKCLFANDNSDKENLNYLFYYH